MSICRLKFYNPWGVLTHLDSSSLTALDLISSNWSLCCTVSTALSVVRRQLPSSSSFVQFLLAFPCLLPVTSRSRAQVFVWFRAKTDKGTVCLADHLHSVTKETARRSKSIKERKILKDILGWKDRKKTTADKTDNTSRRNKPWTILKMDKICSNKLT